MGADQGLAGRGISGIEVAASDRDDGEIVVITQSGE
jgi:hypothetical protein